MKRAAFIGTGAMGSALIRAACQSIGPDEIVLANRTPEKAAALARELGCVVADNRTAVAQAEYCFLCVKPQALRDAAADLADGLRGKTLVSIAAGVQIQTIQAYLGQAAGSVTVVRVMPNTPAEIGKGMLALTGGADCPAGRLDCVEEILKAAGRIERIPEEQMDAFSALAGCGPAFAYQFIEALADGGVMAGLPRRQAQIYAAQTLMGAAAMVLESGRHPGQLKDEVCSPGGSTIEGVAVLERRAFRSASMEAVAAAWLKNRTLGKPEV